MIYRAQSVEKDLDYCQLDGTEEWKYSKKEMTSVHNQPSCFKNYEAWIYFEWLALFLVISTIITHVIFLTRDSVLCYKIHRFVLIVLIIMLWIRIAKYARPFHMTGPIVVIFSHIIKDIVKCSFLFVILFIPYTCAFWLCFGFYSPNPVTGYSHLGDLLYSMIAMVVGVDFPMDKLLSADAFMAQLLCSTFIISTAIIVVNILIAILSHTFTRLYSNAVENAVMQRARGILKLEKTMGKNSQQKFYNYMREHCSPQVTEMDAEFQSGNYKKDDRLFFSFIKCFSNDEIST